MRLGKPRQIGYGRYHRVWSEQQLLDGKICLAMAVLPLEGE